MELTSVRGRWTQRAHTRGVCFFRKQRQEDDNFKTGLGPSNPSKQRGVTIRGEIKSIPRSLGTETGLLPVEGKASKMLTHTAALTLKTSYQRPRNPWPPSPLAQHHPV